MNKIASVRACFPVDVDLTLPPYGLSPDGSDDCSPLLQAAIDDLAAKGGGTLLLPRGDYLMRSGVVVRPFVTLTGEGDATVILAAQESTDKPLPALFEVCGSAGVTSLSIFYPGQNVDAVKPFPFIFNVSGGMLQTIADITVYNGYNGISACISGMAAHEMMTVENFRGTFLNCAAMAYNQSDVGTWKNVCVSPDIWADAPKRFSPPDRERLRAITRERCTALILGDLEWTEFCSLKITGCKTAVNIVKGKRIEFAGSMYDMDISDCENGIIVDALDTRWGMAVANCRIDCPTAIDNRTVGLVLLTGASIKGRVINARPECVGESFSYPVTERNNIHSETDIYTLDAKEGEISGALQRLADSIDGGIIYIKAGVYRLDRPVWIGKNTELRGSSPVGQRGQGGTREGGTVILTAYGMDCPDPDISTALVNLAGENAGISGIRFICDRNTPYEIKPMPYIIRGFAAGVYAINCAAAAAWNGIDFRGCDRHYIKRFVSCCYMHAITAGCCEDGFIEGCLQNGTVIARNALQPANWMPESEAFPVLFDGFTRQKTVYLTLSGAHRETVLNTFAYGVRTLVKSVGSEDTTLINVGADNIGIDAPYIEASGGSMRGFNLMRYNGRWTELDRCAARLYNKLAIGDATKK